MVELEELVPRRDYRLKIDWICYSCQPEDQWRNTQIFGCCLPGEEKYNETDGNGRLTEVGWEDIFHIKCINGHITKPRRVCTRCNTVFPHNALICNNCEDRVTLVLTIEAELNSLKEQYRRQKRKKFDVTDLESRIKRYESDLHRLDVNPCIECGLVWGNGTDFICKDCSELVQ